MVSNIQKGDKVWVHEDNTDLGIAEVIARAGIPKSKIVLGFWAVHSREVLALFPIFPPCIISASMQNS
ncbi:MAG: element excision factor XisI family protein [Chitinophagales bacterium]